MSFPNAADGLKKLFYAQIIAIVTAVLAIIPILGWIAAIVGAIACLVLQLQGLSNASADHQGYKTALIFTIVSMAVSVLSQFLQEGLFKNLCTFTGSVLDLIILYIVIHVTAELLGQKGRYDIASTGKTVWALNVASLIASAVVLLLAILALLGLSLATAIISGAVAVISAVISIVAGIMYIVFLYKASNAL